MMNQKWVRAMRLTVAFVIIACVVFGACAQRTAVQQPQCECPKCKLSWVQVTEGVRTPLAAVQDAAPAPLGTPLVLETTLENVQSGDMLLFFTEHRSVRVYADDILLYDFLPQDAFAFLQTPGSTWNRVVLAQELNGATLRIELTAHNAYYNQLMYDGYLVSESEVSDVMLHWIWMRLLTGLFLLVIAILSYMNGGIWQGTQTRRYVVTLADFYLAIAVWSFAKSGLFTFLFGRPILSYLIEMLAIRLVPIVAYIFVRSILARRYAFVTVVGHLAMFNFAIAVVLQFVFGVSFLDTLWVTHALLLFGAGTDFLMIFYRLYKTRAAKNDRNYLFLCTGIMFLSAIAEIWRFYLLPEQYNVISGGIAIGYVLYTILAHVILVRRSAMLDMRKVSMEEEVSTLKNTTLVRQINAHFFFNTLNTVSALCKSDPAKADDAVTLLAKYMRHYMYFVSTPSVIPFYNELELIRVYLNIEQIRFGNAFEVEMQMDCTDFQLPPLAVQPLVENAIMHGLRQQERYGYIKIATKRIANDVVITVEDNGVGFAPEQIEGEESLAIKNIRTRLADMVQGSLIIESEIGVGTRATVTLPYKPE